MAEQNINSTSINFRETETISAIIKEFIDTYKQLPELWNVKNPFYSTKSKRNAAYDILLPILKKLNQSATRYHVRQKINSIRSNYKKELRRHLASRRLDANGEESYGYMPSSWKFYELRFLDRVDEINGHVPTNIAEVTIDNTGDYEDTDKASDDSRTFYEEIEEIKPHVDNSRDNNIHYKNKRMKFNREYLNSDMNNSEVDNVSNSEFEAIGANVAFKLKRMNPQQRYHAELLINKVLINGLKNSLTDDTDLTDLQVLDMKTFQDTSEGE